MNERYRYAIICGLNMKFKKRTKEDINCVLHSPPPRTTSPLSLFCMHEALFCMHKPTHNYHVVFFVGSNPGFCQPDWGRYRRSS